MNAFFHRGALAALMLAACQGNPAPMPAPSTQDQQLCEQLAALPPEEIEVAQRLAASIQDPVLQAAAVVAWIKEHRAALPREPALALCRILEQPAAAICERQITLAHLRR